MIPKSMLWTICTISLMAGCSQTEAPTIEEALFCDVEEPRRFSQAEINWRAENAPWNLRKDYKTNLAWDRECAAVEE